MANPKFSKMHYEELAKVVALQYFAAFPTTSKGEDKAGQANCITTLANPLLNTLQQDNPKFDTALFLRAVVKHINEEYENHVQG